jgi:transcriptional regulator of heat shock response
MNFKIAKLKEIIRNIKKWLQYIFQNPSKKTQNVVMNDDIQNKRLKSCSKVIKEYMSMYFQDVRDDLIWYDMLCPFCYYIL